MNSEKVRKGGIYIYDFGEANGSVQAGRRPVLVVQEDRMNETSPTTVVAAITSIPKKKYMPSHVWIGEECGLRMPSQVLLEQIRTVNQDELGMYIGSVRNPDTLRLISAGIKKQFGLWSYRKEHSEELRCLCPECAADYRAYGTYVVRRADPFSRIKETCQKCGRPGHDYIVFPKHKAQKGENDD